MNFDTEKEVRKRIAAIKKRYRVGCAEAIAPLVDQLAQLGVCSSDPLEGSLEEEIQQHWNVLRQIRTMLPTLRVNMIFDVGANIGNFTARALHAHPDATIFAFEPTPETALQLSERFVSNPNVKCFQWALGAEEAVMPFSARGTSTMNRIEERPSKVTIDVRVRSGDGVCAEIGVNHISILKVDAEGHDVNVLHGFKRMLMREAVDLVQVEAGLKRKGTDYVIPLEEFKAHLEQFGYSLFMLNRPTYGHETVDGKRMKTPRLRYCDAVFISTPVARANARPVRQKA
jgi:FkbM family methyltransferase